MSSLADFDAITLTGQPQDLGDYAGKVVLVVNTASKCGFTPQYAGLQELHDRYADEGLVILGFPCNQFGKQEPGESDDISEFCQINYGVTFQMFSKVDVNGDDAHPLFDWLKSQQGGMLGDRIKWNFTKFLIGKDGQVLGRYAPKTTPAKMAGDIEAALAA